MNDGFFDNIFSLAHVLCVTSVLTTGLGALLGKLLSNLSISTSNSVYNPPFLIRPSGPAFVDFRQKSTSLALTA